MNGDYTIGCRHLAKAGEFESQNGKFSLFNTKYCSL